MDTSNYKEFLIEFKYPFIDTFSDQQVADIFKPENRFRLLQWLAGNISSRFTVPADWSESSQAEFANFFHQKGFCTLSQKLSFVQGNSPNIDKDTFDRIFHFLRLKQPNENVDPNKRQDLVSFIKKDRTLFPSHGPIKLRSLEQRQRKRVALQEQIAKLRREIAEGGGVSDSADNEVKKVKTEENIIKFTKQAVRLQEAAFLIDQTDKKGNQEKPKFPASFNETLENCNEGINEIVQYLQGATLVQTVDDKSIAMPTDENNFKDIVANLVESSLEVVARLQEAND